MKSNVVSREVEVSEPGVYFDNVCERYLGKESDLYVASMDLEKVYTVIGMIEIPYEICFDME